jgi:hypothetical protein
MNLFTAAPAAARLMCGLRFGSPSNANSPSAPPLLRFEFNVSSLSDLFTFVEENGRIVNRLASRTLKRIGRFFVATM